MQTQTGEAFDCSDCSDRCPDVIPNNVGAWRVWSAACSQWRTSAFSIVGLDLSTALQLADVYGVEKTPGLIRKLKALESAVLSKHREANEDGQK